MPDSSSNGPAAAALRAVLDEALAARHQPAAVEAALSAVRSGRLGIAELYTEVLAPLLVDTGSRWQQGAQRVWEEHFASATVRTIVEALYFDVMAAASSALPLGRSALLACPPGEQHDIGLRMVADRMRLAGWGVYFLGADTPVDEIAAAARTLGVELVVLSAATHYNLVLLRSVVDRLELELPDVRVVAGGPALSDAEPWPNAEVLTEDDFVLGSDGPGRPERPEPAREGEGS